MRRLQGDKRDGWYEITPADAVTFMAGRTKNRPLSEVTAERMASAMRRRAWNSNGESIVLSNDGRLLDGQHRMRACIIADKPFPSYVVFLPHHLSDTAFDTIDQGRSRNMADRLHMEEVKYATLTASIARLAVAHQKAPEIIPINSNKTISVAELRRFWTENRKELEDVVGNLGPKLLELRGWVRYALLGFVYFHARRYDPALADEWLSKVVQGTGLTATDPAALLRSRLQQEALRKAALKPTEQLALIIKCWRATALGEKVGVLRWTKGEDWPDVVIEKKARGSNVTPPKQKVLSA